MSLSLNGQTDPLFLSIPGKPKPVQNQKEASHFNYILTYMYRANAIIQCDAKLQLQVSDMYLIPTNITIDESERKSSKEWLKSSTLSLELTCNT